MGYEGGARDTPSWGWRLSTSDVGRQERHVGSPGHQKPAPYTREPTNNSYAARHESAGCWRGDPLPETMPRDTDFSPLPRPVIAHPTYEVLAVGRGGDDSSWRPHLQGSQCYSAEGYDRKFTDPAALSRRGDLREIARVHARGATGLRHPSRELQHTRRPPASVSHNSLPIGTASMREVEEMALANSQSPMELSETPLASQHRVRSCGMLLPAMRRMQVLYSPPPPGQSHIRPQLLGYSPERSFSRKSASAGRATKVGPQEMGLFSPSRTQPVAAASNGGRSCKPPEKWAATGCAMEPWPYDIPLGFSGVSCSTSAGTFSFASDDHRGPLAVRPEMASERWPRDISSVSGGVRHRWDHDNCGAGGERAGDDDASDTVALIGSRVRPRDGLGSTRTLHNVTAAAGYLHVGGEADGGELARGTGRDTLRADTAIPSARSDDSQVLPSPICGQSDQGGEDHATHPRSSAPGMPGAHQQGPAHDAEATGGRHDLRPIVSVNAEPLGGVLVSSASAPAPRGSMSLPRGQLGFSELRFPTMSPPDDGKAERDSSPSPSAPSAAVAGPLAVTVSSQLVEPAHAPFGEEVHKPSLNIHETTHPILHDHERHKTWFVPGNEVLSNAEFRLLLRGDDRAPSTQTVSHTGAVPSTSASVATPKGEAGASKVKPRGKAAKPKRKTSLPKKPRPPKRPQVPKRLPPNPELATALAMASATELQAAAADRSADLLGSLVEFPAPPTATISAVATPAQAPLKKKAKAQCGARGTLCH